MTPVFQVDVDTSAVERMFAAFGVALDTGFEKTLKQIGIRSGRSIDLNFKNGGRPDKFLPLAKSTVARRRSNAKRTGKEPVAGYLTPLRVADNLRLAAIATRPGTAGSDVQLTPWGWSNTITLPYAAAQNFGYGNIPQREFAHLQESEPQSFADMIQNDITARLNQVQRGMR